MQTLDLDIMRELEQTEEGKLVLYSIELERASWLHHVTSRNNNSKSGLEKLFRKKLMDKIYDPRVEDIGYQLYMIYYMDIYNQLE